MIVDHQLARTIAMEAFDEPYRQIPPLTTYKLEHWLKDRGIHLPWETIHHLWAIGVLHPIAVDETALHGTPELESTNRFRPINLGSAGQAFIDLGRDDIEEPITTPPDRLPHELRDAVWWHPFQLWQFDSVNRALDLRVPGTTVLRGPDEAERLMNRLASWVSADLENFAQDQVHYSFLEVLALLLAVDPLVHISVFNSCTYDAPTGESADGYLAWIPQQPGASLLGRLGLDTEEVRRWHERFSLIGRNHDPFGPFRRAIRLSDRQERKRLRGPALRAQDFYDTAEILRYYLGRYHAVTLPQETDVGSLGPLPAGTGLRELVRPLGLDPQERVRWFVEGQTEEAYIHAWAERSIGDIRLGGIDLRNVKGTGNFNPVWLLPDLEYCRREKIFAYVSVDEDTVPAQRGARAAEPEHLRVLRNYDRELLLPAGFTCWKEDFASANFTPTEIAAIATQLAQQADTKVSITPEEIERARTVAPDGTARDARLKLEVAVKNVLWDKAAIAWGKGVAWGRALAEWAVDHPILIDGRTEMLTLDDDQRPITKLMVMLLGARGADYDLSVEMHATSQYNNQPCRGLQVPIS